MRRKLLSILAAVAIAGIVPMAYAQSEKGGEGLAVGQDPRLLELTRESNAGIGNGGEFLLKRGEADPGNSGSNNQANENDNPKLPEIKSNAGIGNGGEFIVIEGPKGEKIRIEVDPGNSGGNNQADEVKK